MTAIKSWKSIFFSVFETLFQPKADRLTPHTEGRGHNPNMGMLASLCSAFLILASPSAASQPGELRVVDGDTIRLGTERIRLIGLDAPELHGKCRSEKRLALRAKTRLIELLDTENIEIIRSARLDKYRRTLAIVRADGVDVARILISEGLARPYHGERRKSWCEAPR